jgi:hypothetical protein
VVRSDGKEGGGMEVVIGLLVAVLVVAGIVVTLGQRGPQ